MKAQKKTFKGRVSYNPLLSQTLWRGEFAAVATESTRLTLAQLNAAALAIKRTFRSAKSGDSRSITRLNPCISVSGKPAEVRMGQGKGSIKYTMARVRAGAIIFELNAPNELLARLAVKIASSKLPLKLSFIKLTSPKVAPRPLLT